jgi:hypothetical protein
MEWLTKLAPRLYSGGLAAPGQEPSFGRGEYPVPVILNAPPFREQNAEVSDSQVHIIESLQVPFRGSRYPLSETDRSNSQ